MGQGQAAPAQPTLANPANSMKQKNTGIRVVAGSLLRVKIGAGDLKPMAMVVEQPFQGHQKLALLLDTPNKTGSLFGGVGHSSL
jgi:hypothetical protein